MGKCEETVETAADVDKKEGCERVSVAVDVEALFACSLSSLLLTGVKAIMW